LSAVQIEGTAVKVDQFTASTFGLGRRQLAHKIILPEELDGQDGWSL
jgi:hypothetical protein